MEIYIKKDTANRFVLTLSESGTLATPSYLMIFKNNYNVNSVEIPFSTTDLSGSVERYNLFELIESSTGSTTGGTSYLGCYTLMKLSQTKTITTHQYTIKYEIIWKTNRRK
jgi:hypothetical protein